MMANNVSFKGFNNIFGIYNVPMLNKNVSYIAMQLNDDDGVKDLSEYLKLKQMQHLPIDGAGSDVIVLTDVYDRFNRKEHLYLGSKEMFWGDELRTIEEKFVPQFLSKEKYTNEKNLHMKAYTMLASLLKRVEAKGIDGDDAGEIDVIKKLFATLMSLRSDKNPVFTRQEAYSLLTAGCLKTFKFQKVASEFKLGIIRSMERYFR